MLHSIYITIHGGTVRHVFLNNVIDRPDASVCVIDLDEEAPDSGVREYVNQELHNSEDLTEVLIEYPNYESIKETFTQIMREEL